MGVIARADTGTEAQVGEGRGRAAIDLARIEEADHPEIAEAIARLDRRFVDAAAADGIEIGVLRSQLLIAEAAHRPAAAGVEAPRRREPLARGAEARSDTHTPRNNQAICHRIIAADIQTPAAVGREERQR